MDLLVKLYDLPKVNEFMNKEGFKIVRPMSLDFDKVIAFIKDNFSETYASECKKALFNNPTSMFIAVKNKEIVGFAAYDATKKGFFGPMEVKEEFQKQGIGRALLLSALYDMKNQDYGYAIIGWVSDAIGFYQKTINFTPIEDSFPGVYRDMISYE